MRLYFILSILFYSIAASAQNCKPTTNVTVKVCKSKPTQDTLCDICGSCFRILRATDSSFTIISYVIIADGPGFEGGLEEAFNTGAELNEAKRIVSKVRIGSYIAISCIKARDRKGIVYILQPLSFKLQ